MKFSAASFKDRLSIAGKTVFSETISDADLENLRRNISKLLSKADPDFIGIIEVGCGTAIVTEMLVELFPSIPIRAIDPIQENIALCKGLRIVSEGGVVFQIGDTANIETLFPQRHLIFMYEVIQHMHRDHFSDFVDKCFSYGSSSIICGGVPDINHRNVFYSGRSIIPVLTDGADDIIGNWYSRDFFLTLSSTINVQFFDQVDLYTAPYRFDVVLSKK